MQYVTIYCNIFCFTSVETLHIQSQNFKVPDFYHLHGFIPWTLVYLRNSTCLSNKYIKLKLSKIHFRIPSRNFVLPYSSLGQTTAILIWLCRSKTYGVILDSALAHSRCSSSREGGAVPVTLTCVSLRADSSQVRKPGT